MDGNNMQNNQTNVLAIVGLVMGILAIVLGCCMGWVGIIPGIAGIICSVLSKKQGKTGMATAGLICSIIGCVVGLIMVIFGALILAAFAEMGLSY